LIVHTQSIIHNCDDIEDSHWSLDSQ